MIALDFLLHVMVVLLQKKTKIIYSTSIKLSWTRQQIDRTTSSA
jgi:hypothetical protein